MPRLRYLTAGESHGEMLVGILDGMPAGVMIDSKRDIDPILRERQKGYGRSRRQQIENDTAVIVSGVRFGVTTGAPIAFLIQNNDWQNWKEKMSISGDPPDDLKRVTIPRPGHSDFAGAVKYAQDHDVRNAFERASARETAMRVAIGAAANKFLKDIGIISISFVRSIGTVTSESSIPVVSEVDTSLKQVTSSPLRLLLDSAQGEMINLIDSAKEQGDTLGGVVEAVFYGVPIGIGSQMQWDRKLDAALAQSLMSIQAVKSVEVGTGKNLAYGLGSQSHDEFIIEDKKKVSRRTNNAGGVEGGMSNGEPIVVRVSMKPISTLMKPLKSFDIGTRESTNAHIERSDVCAVPALSVIVENVAALTIADLLLDTFGGDTLVELRERIQSRCSV